MKITKTSGSIIMSVSSLRRKISLCVCKMLKVELKKKLRKKTENFSKSLMFSFKFFALFVRVRSPPPSSHLLSILKPVKSSLPPTSVFFT